jgi:eukaryotic-like serine/threonine-protein kinase
MHGVTTSPAPYCTWPETSWGFRPGEPIAPGRKVVRRLAGGGAHEAFVVEADGGVAVAKLPRPHLADDPHCLLRLRGEARALQRLAHPAVPRCLDYTLSGAHPHLLLEHVPGPSLHTVLAGRGTLSPHIVASVGSAIARALAHIARSGWVHLDVKPSNIVLNARPRLLDFELARTAAAAARMRRPAGTWSYMPPEQRAAGGANVAAVGPPADVFGLAASLGEALTGRPFRSWPSPRPHALAGPLGALLAGALAPEPRDRPTAAELTAGLAELAEAPSLAAAA